MARPFSVIDYAYNYKVVRQWLGMIVTVLNILFSFQGKTVTLKLKNVKFEVKTRALTLPYAVATVDEIFAVAKDLLKTERDNESPLPLRLRLMGN